MDLLTEIDRGLARMSRARQKLSESRCHITFQKEKKIHSAIKVYHKFVFSQAQIPLACSVIRQFLRSFKSMPHDRNKVS